jgi:hypothetical protein
MPLHAQHGGSIIGCYIREAHIEREESVSMRWVAKHPRIWWSLCGVLLAACAALMIYLGRGDHNPSDRIALVAAAMSVFGLAVAAVALKWTRETVVLSDRTLNLQILSEEMLRLETVFDAIQSFDQDPPPQDAAARLIKTLGPFTDKQLPEAFKLADSGGSSGASWSGSTKCAYAEVAGKLDSIRIEKTNLSGRRL